MGYKSVCLNCRKAFSTGRDYPISEKCLECGNEYIFYNHKFKPPKKDDIKAWKVVGFLHEHGFNYQHVWESKESYAEYPKTLEEAKEFVIKYKSQAKTTKLND